MPRIKGEIEPTHSGIPFCLNRNKLLVTSTPEHRDDAIFAVGEGEFVRRPSVVGGGGWYHGWK